MFYHNTKYKFKLQEGTPADLAGGIIAASAMMRDQLARREVSAYRYLRHRYFDPQLYLCLLDAARARSAVANLATYPWFGPPTVEPYDSSRHGKLSAYKAAQAGTMRRSWRRAALTDPAAVGAAAEAAVQLQVDLGCEGVILPAPLVDSITRGYQDAAIWVDAGLEACRRLRVTLPVFASVAICDTVLQNRAARSNPVLSGVTAEIASRAGLAGAYIVIETRDEDAYSFEGEDTARGLLTLVDDLVRGARRQVIVNYAGCFGAICRAAGAKVWASGYYLSQRRLRAQDLFYKTGGAAYPRYFSLALAGDVGLEEDLDAVVKAGLLQEVLTPTAAAEALHEALRLRRLVASEPDWAYEAGRVTRAGAHYNECMRDLGAELDARDDAGRVDFVERWLDGAASLAERLRDAGIPGSRATELTHQATWLGLFGEWKREAGR